MKKILRILFKTSTFTFSSVIQITFAVIAFIAIFGLSYIIGYKYLLGDTLLGNDTLNFFTIVDWVHQYFPHMPFWYHLQGGGVSFTGYPWFAAYLVNLIDHFSSYDLVQSFRLLGFLSVPLTGIGLFIFVWTRLTDVKPVWMRQILGIIASLFYIAAPVSWIWLVKWGFYAEQISIIFVPWVMLFLDLFIERLFAKKYDFLFRLGFVGAIIFWVLGFITHFFAGVSVIPLFSFMILVRFILNKENKWQLAKRLFLPLGTFCLLLTAVFLFRYYSYTVYTKAVAKGGFTGYPSAAQNKKGAEMTSLTAKMTLSLEDPQDYVTDWRSNIKDMRLPFYVWILTIPSLLFAVFRSKKIFIFSILGVWGFLFSTNIDFLIFATTFPLINKIPILNQFPGWLSGRIFFVTSRVYIPIIAAYGAYIVWELTASVLLQSVKKVKAIYYTILPIKILTVLALTLLTVGTAIFKYYHLPYDRHTVNAGAFESQQDDSDKKTHIVKIDLRDIWGLASRPEEIGTAVYDKTQEQFLFNNPKYFPLADYIYLQYLCTFDGPGKRTSIFYQNYHLCSHYQKLNASVFPPLAKLEHAKIQCLKLPRSKYFGELKYCRAFYPDPFEQLAIHMWHPFSVSDAFEGIEGTARLFDVLPKHKEYRYDLSGYVGKSIQAAPFVNKNSMLQIYIGTLSLMYNAWNYQAQVMYTQFPLYQKPGALSELAKWFGLDYVFLAGPPMEPHAYWATDPSWLYLKPKEDTKLRQKEESSPGAGWRMFTQSSGLTTWDSRPKMLVISDDEKFFYTQSFKFFTQGALLYDQVIPVRGEKEIDAYSYDELKNFDLVFMRGYAYRWKWNAYNLLDKYVKNGGKLLFDTGWQYYVPDYKIDNAPSFMPFDRLTWENLSIDSQFTIEDSKIAKDIDASKMGDLVYENGPWGVSVPGALRQGAKTVLSYDGKPLSVVSGYGKGKVAWFGFNIIPHSEAKDSYEELKLFNRLVEYLNGGFPPVRRYSINKKRDHPDEITFTLQESTESTTNLYYREAFYSDWKAKLRRKNGDSESIKVYSGGPGYMLLTLPAISYGDKLELKIQKSPLQFFSQLVSFITGVCLLVYLLLPQILWRIARILGKNLKLPLVVGHVYHKTIRHKVVKLPDILGDSEDKEY